MISFITNILGRGPARDEAIRCLSDTLARIDPSSARRPKLSGSRFVFYRLLSSKWFVNDLLSLCFQVVYGESIRDNGTRGSCVPLSFSRRRCVVFLLLHFIGCS